MILNQWLNDSVLPKEKLAILEKRLRQHLKRFNKHQALLGLWEVQRLQVKADQSPPRISGLPHGGLGRDITDGKPYFVPWVIEQAINIISIFGHEHNYRGNPVDPFHWKHLSQLYNLILAYNNARDGVFLQENDIFSKMSKIGRQQLPWQDLSLNLFSMELYAKIYLGEICSQASQNKYGINPEDFLSYGFLLVVEFTKFPYLQLPYDFSKLGGDGKILDTVLKRYSASNNDFNKDCRILRKSDPFGEYSKSPLRLKPIISLADGRYFCPMPKLLQFRITSGLISETHHHGGVVNEVGKNFENYCIEKLATAFSNLECKPEERYGSRNRPKDTPDIRLYNDNYLQLIIECKATLLRFEDKFETLSIDTLPKKSDQIVKGILQVWRYVRDIKQGVAPDELIRSSCKGLVITLEDWILMDKDRHNLIMKEANKLADDERLPKATRIEIITTSIKDFVTTLEKTNFDEFIECVTLPKKHILNGQILQTTLGQNYNTKDRKRNLVSSDILDEKIWYWKNLSIK